MSRRLSAVCLAAAVLASGAGVFTSTASAVDCFTWTDPKGDSAAPSAPQSGPATGEAGLDLTGVTIESTNGVLKTVVRVDDLAEAKPQKAPGGDRFVVRYVLNGKVVAMSFTRDAQAAKTVTFTVDGTAKTPLPTVAWDGAANTVTATLPMADFTAATGAVAGDTLRTLFAEARSLYGSPQVGGAQWDAASARDWYLHTLGTACGPELPDPPLNSPVAECNALTDAPGDAKLTPPVTVDEVESPADNDPDVDITGLVGETTADELHFYVRVARLAAVPARGNGHTFEVGFSVNGKDVSLDAGELDTVGGAVFVGNVRLWIGTANKTANAAPRARFDRARSMVYFSVDRASLETLTGGPIPTGTELTKLYANSYVTVMPSPFFFGADEAPDDGDVAYKVGNNACFRPPASRLTSLLASTVQYGDKANVSAKLTTVDGGALAGKSVKFAVGTQSVSATTDATGVARTQLATSKTAGTHTMTVSFAGDSTADNSSGTAAYTVVLEKTRVTLAVVKKGTARTVTATLKEDDGRALAGQRISWYVNGKKVSTATTNAAGQAVLKTAKAGQTVMAVLSTVAGKYSTSKGTVKA